MTVEPASNKLLKILEDGFLATEDDVAALIARIRQAEAEIGLLREALETSVNSHTAAQKVAVSLIAERDEALARVKVMDEALALYACDCNVMKVDDCPSRFNPENEWCGFAARAARKEPTE